MHLKQIQGENKQPLHQRVYRKELVNFTKYYYSRITNFTYRQLYTAFEDSF